GQRAQTVERGEEVVSARHAAHGLLRREGRVAERRVVVARYVLDARALMYGMLRAVGKAHRRVNEGHVVVVERVERGGDNAERLDVRLEFDAFATVELPATGDQQLDVRRRGEVREGDGVGQVLADAVGRGVEGARRGVAGRLRSPRRHAQA